MMPSPEQLAEELQALEEASNLSDGRIDDAFIAGCLRGVEWAAGKGASPSEFLRMCERVERLH